MLEIQRPLSKAPWHHKKGQIPAVFWTLLKNVAFESGNRAFQLVVFNSSEKMALCLCSNMLELLLEFLWSKTLSVPSFSRCWKQLIGRPYYESFVAFIVTKHSSDDIRQFVQWFSADINGWNNRFIIQFWWHKNAKFSNCASLRTLAYIFIIFLT